LRQKSLVNEKSNAAHKIIAASMIKVHVLSKLLHACS